jgi:pimeloyl-ACP methyl ester carboxylesterase
MSELALEHTTLAYRLRGHDGPWTSLVHGGLVAAPSFRLQAPEDDDADGLGGRVLVYDQRGYGATPYAPPEGQGTFATLAGDLIALWDRLDIERSAIVGFSMGSFVALEAALAQPGRVSGLVLVGSGLIADDARATFRERASAVTSDTFAATVGDHARRAFSPEWVEAHPAEIADYAAAAATADPRAVADTFNAIADWQPPAGLESIGFPVVLVNGERDGLFTPVAALALAERIPGARTVVFEGAGHTLHMEQPERFNALVAEVAR